MLQKCHSNDIVKYVTQCNSCFAEIKNERTTAVSPAVTRRKPPFLVTWKGNAIQREVSPIISRSRSRTAQFLKRTEEFASWQRVSDPLVKFTGCSARTRAEFPPHSEEQRRGKNEIKETALRGVPGRGLDRIKIWIGRENVKTPVRSRGFKEP